MSAPFCRDCRFFRLWPEHECRHEKNMKLCLITGEYNPHKTADLNRALIEDSCGPEGSWFEPRGEDEANAGLLDVLDRIGKMARKSPRLGWNWATYEDEGSRGPTGMHEIVLKIRCVRRRDLP